MTINNCHFGAINTLYGIAHNIRNKKWIRGVCFHAHFAGMNALNFCLIYFRYLSLCFIYTSRLQHVISDMFVQLICRINNIRNNLDVFHYGFLSYMYSVVLVDVCTISSQCYFDYYHKLLTQVFGILLQNFVSHTYIAIRVIKCVFKRAEANSRRRIVRSREISKARGPFLQFSNRSEIW